MISKKYYYPRAKYWCFTINNPTNKDFKQMNTAVAKIEECTYVIYSMEKGTTLHAQGYVEFSKQVRLNWVKKNFNSRANLAMRKGTQKQAIDYCIKADDTYVSGPYEYGKKLGRKPKSKNLVSKKAKLPYSELSTSSLKTMLARFCDQYDQNYYRTNINVDLTMYLLERIKRMEHALALRQVGESETMGES